MRPPSAIMETVIYAMDLEASEVFYRDVFGLELVSKMPGRFVFFKCGQQMLLVFDPKKSSEPNPNIPIPRHGSEGQSHFCFYAKDAAEVDAWRRHFVSYGIEIEHEHTWETGAKSVYIRDPANNSVEVGEAKLWGLA